MAEHPRHASVANPARPDTGLVTTKPRVGEPDIVSVRGVFKVARQIAPQVEALLAAAEADGIKLGCASSYRPIEEHIRLRKQTCGPTDYDIWQKPSDQCTTPTARPGTSNHEKGLAIDFTYNGKSMTRDDPGFRWLAAMLLVSVSEIFRAKHGTGRWMATEPLPAKRASINEVHNGIFVKSQTICELSGALLVALQLVLILVDREAELTFSAHPRRRLHNHRGKPGLDRRRTIERSGKHGVTC